MTLNESRARALARLCECVDRSPWKGFAADFLTRKQALEQSMKELHVVHDVIALARRNGYELCRREGGEGVAVLESARLQDRVAFARTPEGRWVCTDVRQYVPRGPDESRERALARLRQCVDRSPWKGPATQFLARKEALKRGADMERVAPRPRERETQVIGRAAAAPDLNQCRPDWVRFLPQAPNRGGRGPER